MKRILTLILTMAITLSMSLALVGCNSPKNFSGTNVNNESKTGDKSQESENKHEENDSSLPNGDVAKKIGIIQIVEHPSLNTIRESIISELEANGYKNGENILIDYQNAQNDMSNLKTICQKFSSSKYDMIIAIATPSAVAAMNETTDIPIIFSACTDPVGSGLVSNLENPGGNITGTSDAVSAQMIIELALKITPNIKTIGALYNMSEPNSVSVINDLKDYANKNGMRVVEGTVASTADVQQAVSSLCGKADAIFTPIDNTVASAMPVVADKAIEAKIPVYVGADSLVEDGGLATYGIKYEVLGVETAKMVIEVLEGRNPGEIPVKMMTEMEIYLNLETAREINVSIPDEILSKAIVLKE